jgi:formate hydrogenlyase transcriptional activator
MNDDKPFVYVVDDDSSMRDSLRNLISSTGRNVQTFASAHEFLSSHRPQARSCLVLDVQLPGLSGLELQQELVRADIQIPIIFISGYVDIPMTVRAMKAGAVEFLTKPIREEDLLNAVDEATDRDYLIDQSKSKAADEMTGKENLPLREDHFPVFEEIVGSSDALRKVLEQVVKVAPADSTVLITGETGTGKELIARAIHKRSNRSTKPFIAVNCAAIPQSLIASELFGHEKGAFTGAVQRRVGRFEAADGGTLFLDEIGELPMETQIALLRVLQEREIERIGGNRPIPVNVRVLAASNRDLKADVASEAFRQDLFYRLDVFPIQVPPLRERGGDISLLVAYLIERFATKTGKKIKNISKRTLELFQGYSWPGNIRELQNVVERSVILCDGETVSVDETWLTNEHVTESGRPLSPATRRKDESRERRLIEAVLAESKGRVAGPFGAAAILGIPRQTLESKIASLCINKYRFRAA